MSDRDAWQPRDRASRSRGAPQRGAGEERARHASGRTAFGGDLSDSFGLTGAKERPGRDSGRAVGDRQRGRSPRAGDRQERRDREDRPPRERPTGSRIRAEDEGHAWPEVPDWVDTHDLGSDVLADLRGLSKQGADFVAGHLAAAGELADTDPEQAWEHARAARSQGGRIAVVRETVGLVAYRAGRWSDALAELRAARRMAGGPGLLAVMADAERALGRPDRAVEMARSPEARSLDAATAAEMQIVVAGARSDLGQHDAALAALGAAAREVDPTAPYAFRLYYAYGALLADAGRVRDAIDWFVRAADSDADDESDAGERAQALAQHAPGPDGAAPGAAP